MSRRHPRPDPAHGRTRAAEQSAAGHAPEPEPGELEVELEVDLEVELEADLEADPDALEADPEAGRDRPQPLDQPGVPTSMASAAWQAAAAGPGPGRAGDVGDVRDLREGRAAAELAGLAGEPTDAAIMLRVRNGDDAAFTYLIEKYQRPIVHFMFRMVHNQAVAEELAQEVFLRVYRSRESYRAEAKFTTWLYRIATNLGVNHARDHKHERAAQNLYLDQPDAETGSTPDVADSRASVEQELVRQERLRAIRRHVMALPERQRNAVLMHKFQEMDYKQIGEVLKLSESATKSLLFRAYQTLRESLKEYV